MRTVEDILSIYLVSARGEERVELLDVLEVGLHKLYNINFQIKKNKKIPSPLFQNKILMGSVYSEK